MGRVRGEEKNKKRIENGREKKKEKVEGEKTKYSIVRIVAPSNKRLLE